MLVLATCLLQKASAASLSALCMLACAWKQPLTTAVYLSCGAQGKRVEGGVAVAVAARGCEMLVQGLIEEHCRHGAIATRRVLHWGCSKCVNPSGRNARP